MWFDELAWGATPASESRPRRPEAPEKPQDSTQPQEVAATLWNRPQAKNLEILGAPKDGRK